MTREEAIQQAIDYLDDYADREVEKYLDRHGYDPEIEDELAQWKATLRADIEKRIGEMIRSMLH